MSDASTIKKYTSVFSCSSTISEANVRSVGRTLDVVTCSRSVRDLDDDAPRQVSEVLVATHGLNSEYTTPLELLSSTPVLKKAALTSLSPSGKRTFVGTAAGDDGDTPILMVNGGATGNDLLLKVDASTVHGKVMADMHFGGVSWSADERYVAYVAKPKEAKLGTPFDAGDAIDKGKAKDKKPDEGQARGEDRYKFDYVEDWGEKNVGLSSTVIAVLDTVSGGVQVVVPRGPATDTTVGQPLLLPTLHGSTGVRLVYSGWSTLPRRLGKLYCMQRPSSLFQVTLMQDKDTNSADHGEHICLTPNLSIAHSPRLVPGEGKATMVFVGRRDSLATHHGCLQLYRLDEGATEPTLVVDVVRRPTTSSSFPGLFPSGLLPHPFISDVEFVVNTQWRSRTTAVAVNVNTGSVRELTVMLSVLDQGDKDEWNDTTTASTRILDVHHTKVFFGASSPNCPERYGLLCTESGDVRIYPAAPRVAVTSKHPTPEPPTDLLGLKWKIFTLTDPSDGLEYEGILLLPPGDGPRRVLLVPHGGPHSALPTSFIPSYAFLALHLGIAVVYCNYRGSVGFGQDSIDSLPGRIGTNDVKDCMSILNKVLREHADVLDASRVAVAGGSHGGFLTGHLVGQYPDTFKVAAMRNPVTNIPPMVTTTDIVDWCYVEALGLDGYDFDSLTPPTVAQLQSMFECSPIAHVKRVRTPLLMCLGLMDLRVPKSQGVEYYHMLKAQGCVTRMVHFPQDTHAIDRPMSEASHWVIIADWINEHMP